MGQRSRPLAALSALLFVTVLAFAPTAGARPLETGVTTPDLGPGEQLGFNRIKAAGAGFTRVIIFWAQVAPQTEPSSWDPSDPDDPNYDWSASDEAIQMASNAGVKVLASIYAAPSWAERCKADIPGICNPDPAAFADFAEAAAKRYSGKNGGIPWVRYWKAWNEPNLFLFFLPQFKNGKKVSPDLYRNLLNGFAQRIKAVNASNKIVGGGLAPLQRPGGLGPLDFMRRLLCLKGRQKPVPAKGCNKRARFDIWANNPYTTGGPFHESAGPDDVSLGDLPEVRKVAKAAKRYRKVVTKAKRIDLWVTEFSWDSKGPDPGGVPMKRLSQWVPAALQQAWRAGVSKFFWLTLRDWPRADGLPYSQTIEGGLYFRGPTVKQDRAKPILKAFRFPLTAARKRRGIALWGRTPSSRREKVIVQYARGGGWRKIATFRAGAGGVFNRFVKTRLGKGNRGRLRARVVSGSARNLGGQVTSMAYPLKPIRDYFQPPFG